MKRAVSLVVIVVLAAVVSPSLADAQRAGAGRSGAGVSVHRRLPIAQKSVFPQPVDPWKFWGPPSRNHHHVNHHGAFAPFVGASGFIGGSSVIVTTPAPPVVVDISPVFYAPSPAWGSGAEVALTAPASLPTQTLVDHGTGWYQLRGDGMTTPYTWVWIPKAPAAPAPPTEPARLADSNRDPRAEAYHWTDDRGVTTWTNRLEKVPKRFRDQAAATAQPD